MHCEEVRAALLDALDCPPAERAAQALESHLAHCPECRALREDILTMHSRARVWHEVTPPPWNAQPPETAPRRSGAVFWQQLVQQWFPALASSAALLLALGAYRGQEAAPAPSTALPEAVSADQLLSMSRRERRQELQALSALLKAEMDRRSLDTEESLKYIISHQIRSQQQLEAVRGQLQRVQAPLAPGREQL